MAVALTTVALTLPATSIGGHAADSAPRSTVATTQHAIQGRVQSTPLKSATFTKPRREVFGYVNAANIADATVGYPGWDFNSLTTIAFFGLHVNAGDGSFAFDASWNSWNSSNLANLVSAAHAAGVKVVPSILLHDFSSTHSGTVNTGMCQGLSTAQASHTIGDIVSEVRAKNADGVNIDYEGSDQLCPGGLYQHQMLDSMMASLRAAMPSAYISIATYNASYQGGYFDIKGLNPYVDSFFLMDYDSDSSNYHFEPLVCATYCFSPVGPLNSYYYNDTNSVTGYLGLVPASKVILGVPYYGYTACVPGANRPGPNAVPPTDPTAARWTVPRYVDSVAMPTYYDAYNYALGRDPFTHEDAYATWYSKNNGCWREEVWDDTTSLGAKYDLANNMNLRGIGIFTLDYGGNSPELWQLLHGKFGGCAVPTLSSSVTSPLAVGGTVSFSSATSGCPSPIYAYWVQSPSGVWDEVRGYSSASGWSWNTNGLIPGTYNVVVWVKNNGGDVNAYDTFATTQLTFNGCATVGLNASLASPQPVGSSYTFTGTTTGCPAPQYQFWLQPPSGKWQVVQSYSSTSTWTWNTAGWIPGTYNLAVWVRQRGSGNPYDQGGGGPYSITSCTSASLSPSPGFLTVGGIISFTGSSSGGCPNPEYEFWTRRPGGVWSVAQRYSSTSTFSWNTTGFVPGNYQVVMWARQPGSGTPAGYDAFSGGQYTLDGCSSVSLGTSPSGSAPRGTTVTVSSSASGCPAPEYSLWYKPVSGGQWRQIPYTTNGTFAWSTSGLAAGSYYVVVWARQTGSGTAYDTSQYTVYKLV